MNDYAEKFRILLDTYKLAQPVSPGDQAYIMRNRVPDLKAILRKTGRYTLFYWAAVLVFAWFRKFGLHITMVQGKIVAAVLAAAVASGSTAAAVSGARFILRVIESPQARIEEKGDRAAAPVRDDRGMDRKGMVIPAGREKPARSDKPQAGEPDNIKNNNGIDAGTASDVPSL